MSCSEAMPIQPESPEYSQSFESMGESGYDSGAGALLVTGVSLPRAFAPCLHSDEISIAMNGFTDGCKLVFADADGQEHYAELQSYSSGKLRFRLPASVVSGDYRLAVTCADARQDLGSRYVMCDTPAGTSGVNVCGKVTLGGRPASKVVISDGFEFTVTDADGCYRLVSEKTNGYVFAQTPADAVAAADRSIPQFFHYFTSKEQNVMENADFAFEPSDNSVHRMIITADLHLCRLWYAVELCDMYFTPDLNATVEATKVPCFIFTAGDQTTESRWVKYNFDLNDWRNYVSKWNCPVYHCMGNHDNDPQYVASDWDSESTFKNIIGPSWYSLDIGKVHYVVLDDIVYDNSDATKNFGYYVRVASHQLEYLRKDLLKVLPSTPVIIISHSPMLITKSFGVMNPRFESWDDINELLDCLDAFKEVHFLSGHTHINHNAVIRPGITEHNIAAGSASTWLGEWHTGRDAHYCRDGVIGGYQIWDADGSEISWVHKSVGRTVEDGQFHYVDLNEVPESLRATSAKNAVLINVYNYDPDWSIKVSENGKSLPVKQTYRKDPVYNLIFPSQISSQTTPVNTEHLFMAEASSADSALDIEVTDRFGNVYRKTMKRPFAFTIDNYTTKDN